MVSPVSKWSLELNEVKTETPGLQEVDWARVCKHIRAEGKGRVCNTYRNGKLLRLIYEKKYVTKKKGFFRWPTFKQVKWDILSKTPFAAFGPGETPLLCQSILNMFDWGGCGRDTFIQKLLFHAWCWVWVSVRVVDTQRRWGRTWSLLTETCNWEEKSHIAKTSL